MMVKKTRAATGGGVFGLLVAAMIALILSWPLAAQAQDQVFVQIESNATLTTTEARARAYAQVLPDVNGFRAKTGLYAIALGPYAAADAPAVLRDVLARGLVPRDSFIVDGSIYAAQVFPIAGAALAATVPVAADPAPQAAIVVPAKVIAGAEAEITPLPEPAPIPEETLQEARLSEAQLDRPARDALQIALQWFGFYNARIDGDFGAGTRRAMSAWQQDNGFEPTGVLTTAQRDALLSAYEGELAALGMETVRDARAGMEISLPLAMVRFAQYNFPFAQFDAANDSGIQVMLISQAGDRNTLFGLYEIMQTLEVVPLTGERARQGDRFLLTGQSDILRSHTEARLVGGAVKGFTIVWPPEQDARIARVLPMMQDSFRPIDGTLDPGAAPPEDGQAVDLVAGLSVRAAEMVRSGFYIDANGLVMTTAEAVAGQCARILIDEAYPAEIALRDEALGLAVLRPLQRLAPMAYAELATAPGQIRSDIAVAGFPFDGALGGASMGFGTLADLQGINGEQTVQRLDVATAESEAGGPVFDSAGTVLGMVLPGMAGGRALPDNVTLALRADQLGDALKAVGITTRASTRNTMLNRELLARLGAEMTVTVSCWN